MSELAVELRNVEKHFGDLTAVHPLSLEVPVGAVYGFIGPNGAGKTTTIRMIMDIIAPDRGEVLFMGRPRDRETNGRIGYLPEERGLYKMKIGWTLEYFARLKGFKDRKWIHESGDYWLERFELMDRKHDRVEALSKGNQQKVQFITTILHDPDVVILDEPFSGLDPVNTELVSDIIAELKTRGKTVIFSTHVMEQAEKLCEHVFMISKGKKVLDGQLSETKAQFGKPIYAVEFDAGQDGVWLARLPFVESVEECTEETRTVYEVSVAPDEDAGQRLLGALASRGAVRRVERMEPSLHDLFVMLAQKETEAHPAPAPAG